MCPKLTHSETTAHAGSIAFFPGILTVRLFCTFVRLQRVAALVSFNASVHLEVLKFFP